MVDVLDIDISDTIDQTQGGFWFNFEPALLQKDDEDPNTQTLGDLSGEPRGICKFFLSRNCSKGAQCQFRHARAERSIVCKHWLRALCKKGDSCEFLHRWDLARMPECYFFSKFGECSNPECMYLHINPEDKVKECPWYARGFCRHGEKCRHKHVRKVLCDNYFLGFCPAGPNCKFGHPQEVTKEIEMSDNTQRKQQVVCHKCGVTGHKAGQCPNFSEDNNKVEQREKRPLEAVTCFKCGQLGHYANNCSNPASFVQQQQNQQRMMQQQQHQMQQQYGQQDQYMEEQWRM